MEGLRRRAKYLLFDLEGGLVLICHLGMSGRMSIRRRGDNRPADPHDHVVFTTEEGNAVVFNDRRRFGLMTLTTAEGEKGHRLLAGLAPDPLDPRFTGASLSAGLADRRTPVKAALLDQRVVGGVGNIYACEAAPSRRRLAPPSGAERRRNAGASPLRRPSSACCARPSPPAAPRCGDHRQASGELGYFQHRFRVYGREGEPCPTPGCGRDRGPHRARGALHLPVRPLPALTRFAGDASIRPIREAAAFGKAACDGAVTGR